jgi:hypothetical protein
MGCHSTLFGFSVVGRISDRNKISFCEDNPNDKIFTTEIPSLMMSPGARYE